MALPKYQVDGSFVHKHRVHDHGAEVTYKGLPGDNLIPLNDEAKAKKAEWEASREKPLYASEREELDRLRVEVKALRKKVAAFENKPEA